MKTKEVVKKYDLRNDRVLTLVGIAEDAMITQEINLVTNEEKLIQKGTTLSVGWAVKNPTDTVSPDDLGVKIAKGRAIKKPITHIWIDNNRMSDTFISSMMDTTAKEIEERFYSFIPLSDGKNKKKEGQKPKEKEVVHADHD